MSDFINYLCQACGQEWEIEYNFKHGEPQTAFGPIETSHPGTPDEVSLVKEERCPKCGWQADEALVYEAVVDQRRDDKSSKYEGWSDLDERE